MNGSNCIFAKTPINFVDRSSFAYHGIVASTAKVAIISSSTHFLFDFRIFTPYWCFALHFALLFEWNSSRLHSRSKHIQCKSSHSPNREKLINILIRNLKYGFHTISTIVQITTFSVTACIYYGRIMNAMKKSKERKWKCIRFHVCGNVRTTKRNKT